MLREVESNSPTVEGTPRGVNGLASPGQEVSAIDTQAPENEGFAAVLANRNFLTLGWGSYSPNWRTKFIWC